LKQAYSAFVVLSTLNLNLYEAGDGLFAFVSNSLLHMIDLGQFNESWDVAMNGIDISTHLRNNWRRITYSILYFKGSP
jgi:hypothetical protein